MKPHRRTTARALLAVAAALVAATLAAHVWGGSDGGLVVMNQVHGHFVAMGWVTLVALVGGSCWEHGRRRRASPWDSRWPFSESWS